MNSELAKNLIDEACKRFPAGTCLVPAHTRLGKISVESTDQFLVKSGIGYIYDSHGSLKLSDLGHNGVFYYEGVWAELFQEKVKPKVTWEELKKMDGRKVSYSMSSIVQDSGYLSVENQRVYICQNSIIGNRCHDLKGMKYSWEVTSYDFLNVITEFHNIYYQSPTLMANTLETISVKDTPEKIVTYKPYKGMWMMMIKDYGYHCKKGVIVQLNREQISTAWFVDIDGKSTWEAPHLSYMRPLTDEELHDHLHKISLASADVKESVNTTNLLPIQEKGSRLQIPDEFPPIHMKTNKVKNKLLI